VNGSISELSLEAFYRVTGLLATSKPIIQLQKSSLECVLWRRLGRSGISWTFAVTRTRQLNSFRKLQARLKHLHDSDGVCGWLLSGILWVLVLLAGELMLEAIVASQLGGPSLPVQGLVSLLIGPRYIVGGIAMGVAVNRLNWYRRLEHYDTTMAALDRAITNLEAKQASHQPGAAV
jgi:hypothetical protein